jgi:hypothetical protein
MRMGYAKFFSRSHDAVICVYDDAGNVIETHQHTGEFKGVVKFSLASTSHVPLKRISNVSAFVGLIA